MGEYSRIYTEDIRGNNATTISLKKLTEGNSTGESSTMLSHNVEIADAYC